MIAAPKSLHLAASVPRPTTPWATPARIFARVVSDPGPQDYSFDDIKIMPFTTLLLLAQIAEW